MHLNTSKSHTTARRCTGLALAALVVLATSCGGSGTAKETSRTAPVADPSFCKKFEAVYTKVGTVPPAVSADQVDELAAAAPSAARPVLGEWSRTLRKLDDAAGHRPTADVTDPAALSAMDKVLSSQQSQDTANELSAYLKKACPGLRVLG